MVKINAWSAIVSLHEIQPGNGTRYLLMITPVNGPKASENSELMITDGFLVTWINYQKNSAMIVGKGTNPNCYYVAEKMDICVKDAKIISHYINKIVNSAA